MASPWCQCPEPFLDPDDEHAWCWRCKRPIEATDPETGDGLGHAEDEDD